MTADAQKSNQPEAAVRRKRGGPIVRTRSWFDLHLYSLVSSLGRMAQRPLATMLTIGVMAIAIVLPLALWMALANVQRFSGSVATSREISVFLKTDIDVPHANAIAESLRRRGDVASVTVRTPEQGLEEFRRSSDLAAQIDALGENPLPSVLVVQPRDDGSALAVSLQRLPEAEIVQHDAVWRDRLSAWLNLGTRIAWVLAVLLGAGALLVVGNTVRLDIQNRQEEIAVMQLLGATNGFVRRPFLYLGAIYGLASGALALALLLLAARLLQPPMATLIASYASHFALNGPGPDGILALLGGALAIGWLGAWLATGHHLRRSRPSEN
jgi:cell division transport system permease protein